MSRATSGLTHDELDPVVTFRDGLGERQLVVDQETGDTVERFVVCADFADQEKALRERVDRLLNFRNVRFPRVLQLRSEANGSHKTHAIVSEHVPGTRLSDLLAFVHAHPTLVVDVNAALQVAREVLPALAVLHDSRGVTHGALGLERLILTPQARVAIADYNLGAALTKLQFPRTRLWRDYRIAMPPSAGVPRFDARADVASVALAVLELLLGHALALGDLLNALRKLLDEAVERLPNGTVRPLSSSLRGWFDRALPLESRRPFGTPHEAQLALEEVLKKERAYAPAPSALKSFLQRYAAARPEAAPDARPAARASSPGTKLLDFKPAAAPPVAPAPARRTRSAAPRAATRRLTPEQEEAEEIKALEAELARLAQLEAQTVAPVVEPEVQAVAPPTEEVTVAFSEPVIVPAAERESVALAGSATDDSRQPVAGSRQPVIDSARVAESIEVEILTLGRELPVLDVASLSDEATSMVVASPAANLETPLLPSTIPSDDEILELERLLQEFKSGVVAEPSAVGIELPPAEDLTPAWALTSPSGEAAAAESLDADTSPDALRCDRTRALDFDAPPVYVQDLIACGAATKDLVAQPGAIAGDDFARVQMFAAASPSMPGEAASPVRRSRRRRAREGVAHVRALPERCTAPAAVLAVRQAPRLEAIARAATGRSRPIATLSLVPATAAARRTRTTPIAALTAHATPVDARLAVRHESALGAIVAAAVPAPPLHLVPPSARGELAPLLALSTLTAEAVRETDDLGVAAAMLPTPEVLDPIVADVPSSFDTLPLQTEGDLDALLAALEATAENDVPLAWLQEDLAAPEQPDAQAVGSVSHAPEEFPAHVAGIALAASTATELTREAARLEVVVPHVAEPPALDVSAELESELARLERSTLPVGQEPDTIDLDQLAKELAGEFRPATAPDVARAEDEAVAVRVADVVTAARAPIAAESVGGTNDKPEARTSGARRSTRKRSRAKTRSDEPVPVAPAVDTRPSQPPAAVVPAAAAPIPAAELAHDVAAFPEPAPVPYEPWRPPDLPREAPLLRSSRPIPARPADPWNAEAEAAKESQVVPFTPKSVETSDEATRTVNTRAFERAGLAPEPMAATVSDIGTHAMFDWQSAAETAPEPRRATESHPERGWRIDWKRTAAASLAVILLEGVAFATAYWFVKPTEMGTLLVDTSQNGIEVLIDGRRSGLTPIAVQLKPGRYTLEMRGYGVTKVVPVEISPGVQTSQSLKWPRGSRVGVLNVKTTPEGARVLVDGTYRGTAPLTLDDVPVGPHTVVAESPAGIVKNQVEVSEHDPADLDIGIFSGWLTVYAPVEVRVFDGNKLLGTSLDGKLLVSAGPHTLDLVNKRLGYRESRAVEIEPGKESVMSVVAPNGTIIIEAPDGTEVIVDGQPAGTMPLERVTAPIGTREVILKHPAIGQRRMTVTVGADIPVRVSLLAPQ